MAAFKLTPEVGRSPFFRDLSVDQINEIIASGKIQNVAKGSVLFHQDDEAQRTFLVISGQIKLHQVTVDGAQTLLRVVGPGQILAIVSALESSFYPATATPERDSVVVSWDGKALDRLFLRVPVLCRNALGILSARIRELQQRFGELAAERTERRLARALLRLATQVGKKQKEGILLDLALSKQDLAEMTGTTLFSVSRILTDWQNRSWVKTGRQKVMITDPHALVSVAEEEK